MSKKNPAQDSPSDTPGDGSAINEIDLAAESTAPLGSNTPTEEIASHPVTSPHNPAPMPAPIPAAPQAPQALPAPPHIAPPAPLAAAPQPPKRLKPSDNPYAIVALFSGIAAVPLLFAFGIGVVPAIIAIVAGHIALRQLKEKDRVTAGGHTQAKVGLGLGYGALAMAVVVAVVGGIMMLFAAVSFGTMDNDHSPRVCVEEDGYQRCYGSDDFGPGRHGWGHQGSSYEPALEYPLSVDASGEPNCLSVIEVDGEPVIQQGNCDISEVRTEVIEEGVDGTIEVSPSTEGSGGSPDEEGPSEGSIIYPPKPSPTPTLPTSPTR